MDNVETFVHMHAKDNSAKVEFSLFKAMLTHCEKWNNVIMGIEKQRIAEEWKVLNPKLAKQNDRDLKVVQKLRKYPSWKAEVDEFRTNFDDRRALWIYVACGENNPYRGDILLKYQRESRLISDYISGPQPWQKNAINDDCKS